MLKLTMTDNKEYIIPSLVLSLNDIQMNSQHDYRTCLKEFSSKSDYRYVGEAKNYTFSRVEGDLTHFKTIFSKTDELYLKEDVKLSRAGFSRDYSAYETMNDYRLMLDIQIGIILINDILKRQQLPGMLVDLEIKERNKTYEDKVYIYKPRFDGYDLTHHESRIIYRFLESLQFGVNGQHRLDANGQYKIENIHPDSYFAKPRTLITSDDLMYIGQKMAGGKLKTGDKWLSLYEEKQLNNLLRSNVVGKRNHSIGY